MVSDFDPTEYMEGVVDDDDGALDFIGDDDDEDVRPDLDLDEMVNACEVTSGEIAELGRSKFCSFVSQEFKEDWNAHARWLQLADSLFVTCQRRQEVSYEDLAVRAFNTINTQENILFSRLDDASKLAWDAAVRYMCSLILSEDREEFDELVGHDWSKWIAERKKPKEVDDE